MNTRENDRDLAIRALHALRPHRADNREDWLRVGMALHSVSAKLLDEWLRWSAQSEKYIESDARATWRSFGDKPGGITLGTLIKLANQDSPGWRDCDRQDSHENEGTLAATQARCIESVQRRSGGTYQLTDEYDYDLVDSERLRVLRLEAPGKKKEIRQLSSANGRWKATRGKAKALPYRHKELPSRGQVWVVEGERCADALLSLGLAATTSAGGAQAPGRTDWSRLGGRDLVLIPDNDAAGREYVGKVQELAHPETARVLCLLGLEEGGDVVDFIAGRHAAGINRDDIRRELLALAGKAPDSAGSAGSKAGTSSDSWPDPRALPDELPRVQPCNPELLPQPLRAWACDIAERMQCPLDFLAAAIVVALSIVVGRRLGIRPKREDTWLVVPNLWGAVIGRPSMLKTPAVQEALQPLRALERQAKARFEADTEEYEVAQEVYEARGRKLREDIKSALKKGLDPEDLVRDHRASEPHPPTWKRFITNDTTVEKLGELLRDNPGGLLLFRDELTGFLRTLDKPGHEGDRAFYLEGWDGAQPYVYDRIGRGTVYIPSTTVSVFGTIQPGKLARYVRGAVKGGDEDDGLIQRFQLAMWPDPPTAWTNVDRAPDQELRDAVNEVFERLDGLPHYLGVEPELDEAKGIPFLHFDEAAQEEFDSWRAEFEVRLLSESQPALESHLAKYRSLVPSLALLFHLVEVGRGGVGVEPLSRALAWVPVLESHARRSLCSISNPAPAAANALASRIRAGDVVEGTSLREIYNKGWALLGTKVEVEAATDLLEDLDWVRVVESENLGPGRPKSPTISINPRVLEQAEDGAGNTSRTTSENPQDPREPSQQNQQNLDPVAGACRPRVVCGQQGPPFGWAGGLSPRATDANRPDSEEVVEWSR